MNVTDLVRLRLSNQLLNDNPLATPAETAAWMGALQAQDYPAALWAVGLRARQSSDSDIEQALSDGSLVRTWPLRGTLHIVAAADARWITELCAPRFLAGAVNRNLRDFNLDEAEFDRSRETLQRALEGGKQLARDGVFRALNAAGVTTAAQRGYHILWRLALEGLICYGPRRGKPQTFVLLDEWAPGALRLERDAALVELARRYFSSHGPASLYDYAWWSGLPLKDAQAGLDGLRTELERTDFNGATCWFRPAQIPDDIRPRALLLPAYDEYTVAYKDRGGLVEGSAALRAEVSSEMLRPVMVIDGKVCGTWRRTQKKGVISLAFSPFNPLSNSEKQAFSEAAERYSEHLSLGAEADEE